MTVCIDQTAFSRQIDAGHLRSTAAERSCDRPRSSADLQHAVCFFNRKPADNIFPQCGKMIEDRPALFFCDHTVIFFRRAVFCDLQHFILNGAVRILIFSGIKAVIQHRFSDLFSFHRLPPLLVLVKRTFSCLLSLCYISFSLFVLFLVFIDFPAFCAQIHHFQLS